MGRKEISIRTMACAVTKACSVPVEKLTAQERKRLAEALKLGYLNALYRGTAEFKIDSADGPDP